VPKPRKLHIDIDPPVVVAIGDHRVAFVGVNLLRPHVMVEYDIDPPLNTPTPFGPQLLILEVTDDTSDRIYETMWLDFPWPEFGEGRRTTRLERRPPPEATRLHVVVRPAEQPTDSGARPWTSSLPPVAEFNITLPADHGAPWPHEPDSESESLG